MDFIKNSSVLLLLSFATCSLSVANADPETDTLPIDEIRIFSEVFSKIKSDYVETVSDKQLLRNAIRGMLEGLDPHSTYLDKESYQDLQEGATGEFGGIGIDVSIEDGFIKVIAPIDDTPAAAAGIMAGDLITRLNGKSIKGKALDETVKQIRGVPGSDVTLTVFRKRQQKTLEITLTRAIIIIKSVRGELLEPGIAYVRLSHFQSHSAKDLRKKIKALQQENKQPLKGLILDLRNNPGGILDTAVDVCDLFLEHGLIVYTDGRVKDSKLKFNAKPSDLLKRAPMIVLVNGGSASASEIVAGALQDHQRAIIMGEPTFGKGSVQTILPMNDKAALKLTTARYYTPAGRSIQALGIKPDIVVETRNIDEAADTNVSQIKEADLSGHLDNAEKNQSDDADKQTAQDQPKTDNKPALIETDYQLHEALNVLKGLVFFSENTE